MKKTVVGRIEAVELRLRRAGAEDRAHEGDHLGTEHSRTFRPR
jgi:hypothetical protein